MEQQVISVLFQRGKDTKIKTIHPVGEEPIQVFVIQSGWQGVEPEYHVITEYGDFEHTEYQYLTESQVLNQFGLSPEEFEQSN